MYNISSYPSLIKDELIVVETIEISVLPAPSCAYSFDLDVDPQLPPSDKLFIDSSQLSPEYFSRFTARFDLMSKHYKSFQHVIGNFYWSMNVSSVLLN